MAGTPFVVVYKRAITELKDPDIASLFNNDVIMFNQVMHNFLENAIPLFTSPAKASLRVQDNKLPYIIQQLFHGDGVTVDFVIPHSIPEEDAELLLTKFSVDGEDVNCVYDNATNTITFESAPEDGSVIEVTLYFTGSFTLDLYEQEIYILSQLLLSCWSEYVNNNKLDIERLLGDTDFKLTSNASTTTSKVAWNVVNRETATKRMNKFAWDSKILGLYK